jgi:hypothetical protein
VTVRTGGSLASLLAAAPAAPPSVDRGSRVCAESLAQVSEPIVVGETVTVVLRGEFDVSSEGLSAWLPVADR